MAEILTAVAALLVVIFGFCFWMSAVFFSLVWLNDKWIRPNKPGLYSYQQEHAAWRHALFWGVYMGGMLSAIVLYVGAVALVGRALA